MRHVSEAPLEPGDMVVLPPGHVHETPCQVGTHTRCMLFFTMVIMHPNSSLPALYDPLHQVFSFDAIAKLVTHNFFPNQVDPLIERTIICFLEWSSHPKFVDASIRRIVDQAPACNQAAAAKLKRAVSDALKARASALKTEWRPTHE